MSSIIVDSTSKSSALKKHARLSLGRRLMFEGRRSKLNTVRF